MSTWQMTPVAHIESDFPTKFGIPRQSGITETLEARVVFEEPFRVQDAVRGMEGFSHLWLLWVFSENAEQGWSPTVRPPKLGGNTRVGVFASRSPFRPNPIGLSCVKLLEVLPGPVLRIAGADLMNGTPILDIKPYVPYTDSRPEAAGGFALPPEARPLAVEDPHGLLLAYPEEKREAARQLLAADPRPGYSRDSSRVYGVAFAGCDLRFTVEEGCLTVTACEALENGR